MYEYQRNSSPLPPRKSGDEAAEAEKVFKLNEKQRYDRMRLARERKNWSVEDWQRVLWLEESPCELYHPPNHQNDRV